MTCSSTEMAFFHSNFMLHQDDHNPREFHGNSLLGKRSTMSFCEEMHNNGEDELSDDGSQLGEKKRRLNIEQVKTLEKNFELGNKLEPERKMHLARALGLQPRQVAIWFQNRRARWKTKQLEKDYDLLKRQFDALKAENHALQAHNHKLHAEMMGLKTRESINLNKETEGSCSNRSENCSSEIKLGISTESPISANPSRPAFPSSLSRPSGVAQLFQNSSSRPEIEGPKLDQSVKEESSLCNMFCGMDDQTGFWPWLDQQNFN
ncbi:hypothetical protein ACS0TY_010054 [Phlomoides rotata]